MARNHARQKAHKTSDSASQSTGQKPVVQQKLWIHTALIAVAMVPCAILWVMNRSSDSNQQQLFDKLVSFVQHAGGLAHVRLVDEGAGLRGLAAAQPFKAGDPVIFVPQGLYLVSWMAPAAWKQWRQEVLEESENSDLLDHSLTWTMFVATLLTEERQHRWQRKPLERRGWARSAFEGVPKHLLPTEEVERFTDFVNAYIKLLPKHVLSEPPKAFHTALTDRVPAVNEQYKRHQQELHEILEELEGDLLANVSSEEWLWAYSTSSSRNFGIRGAAMMIPIVDMVNHHPKDTVANVQFKSCMNKISPKRPRGCLLEAVHDIAEGTPLRMNYAWKSNADLLIGYGFDLPDNPVLLHLSGNQSGTLADEKTLTSSVSDSFNCPAAVFDEVSLVEEAWVGHLVGGEDQDFDQADLFRCCWLRELVSNNAPAHELQEAAQAGLAGPGPDASHQLRVAAAAAASQVAQRCKAAAMQRREGLKALEEAPPLTEKRWIAVATALLAEAQAAERCVVTYTARSSGFLGDQEQ